MPDERPLERRCRELEALHELAVELLQVEDPDAMLDRTMHRALEILGAERGFLVLRQGERLELKVVRNWSRRELESGREPVSRAILAETLRRGEPLLVPDALTDERFRERDSVQALGIRSVLAAPLEVDGASVGALVLETRDVERRFGPEHVELLGRILALSGRALSVCTRRLVLEQQLASLRTGLLAGEQFPEILTRDLGMLRLLGTLAQVASMDLPVLVEGPSGSGKELIVRALHAKSPRARQPLLVLNCGAISPSLLESELFGHVRGAFTGATADSPGLVRRAHGGTLFLDEVGELPRDLQPKLLRVLQFGEVQPVGGAQVQSVDVRFVAATNRSLEAEVREGRFREDLYYRLNAVTLRLPGLRERPDDVLPLFCHFVERAAARAGRPAPEASAALEQALCAYGWPGNVRELENEACRLVGLTPPGLPLTVDRLSERIVRAVAAQPEGAAEQERQRARVELHLTLAGGNRTRAAVSLGITREGLRKKMRKLGLQ